MQKPENRYNSKFDAILGGLFLFIILAVCFFNIFVMEYRAKNSFGGYVIGNIAAVYDIEGNLVKIEGTF